MMEDGKRKTENGKGKGENSRRIPSSILHPLSSLHGGRLKNKVAIVTGAGRGIGRAIALALAGEGASVIVASRTFSEIAETAVQARAVGGRALAIQADVARQADTIKMVEQTVQAFGTVDILVNNAGVQGPIGPLVENDTQGWIRTVMINLIGTFLCCQAVLPVMIQQRRGKIINLSGGGATAPRPHFSAYAASKAAVVRLTETLAEEVKPYNIQVNAIAPGAVNTRMLEQILAAGPAAGERALAEARLQLETGGTSPELAAALVVFLASDDSDGLTGKLIAAPYDPWREWAGKADELNATPLYTIRRLDPFTLRKLEEG
jgi:3-oxoacyl-[acyl-carrier protein] reductase